MARRVDEILIVDIYLGQNEVDVHDDSTDLSGAGPARDSAA
ncbi:MAG TPA: hypothetical protein VHO07_29230 [Streptosporangiaceae bacterium]|nr:hypothetical protein [Streptosporangiaceae bacterium]